MQIRFCIIFLQVPQIAGTPILIVDLFDFAGNEMVVEP